MDRHNYIPTAEKSQEIREKIFEIKQKLINELEASGVIKRHRKVRSAEDLIDAILLMITENLSLRRLSEVMAVRHNIFMSDTAWEKQILKCADVFEKAAKSVSSLGITDGGVRHTYLIDASNIPVEGGKGASMRLHCSYCPDSGVIVEEHITDWHTAESMLNFNIRKVTLYIGDRAYGRAGQFEYVQSHKADFLIRMSPSHISLYSDENCNNVISFADILRDTPEMKVTLHCYFRYRKKCFPVNVQAFRIPDDKLDTVDRRQRRTAQKKQRKLSENTILFSKWLILATSLDPDKHNLLELYSRRWQIELLFKRSKSIFHFRRLRHSSLGYTLSLSRAWSAVIRLASFAASFFQIPFFDFFSLFASCFA